MKKGILSFYPKLKESVIEYVGTAYYTNDKEFNVARERLIDSEENSPVFKEPVFEPIKKYVETGFGYKDLIEKCDVGGLSDMESLHLKGMLEKIAPIKNSSLYQHQVDSLLSSINNGDNIAVTTGTGSGKSYCFQIPMLINIIKEAVGSDGRNKWLGQAETGTTWWKEQSSSFEYKRKSPPEGRAPGIRALLMYPLNALVQDQIDGLREILCSTEANSFYDQVLDGSKIYFGQYSGSTIGRGGLIARNYN